MADIRIIPGEGVLQFSASSAQTAFITCSETNFILSSSNEVSFKSDVGLSFSSSFILTGSDSSDPFIIHMPSVAGNAEKFKINTQGIAVFGAPYIAPTAIEGGIYYKSSSFYLGIE